MSEEPRQVAARCIKRWHFATGSAIIVAVAGLVTYLVVNHEPDRDSATAATTTIVTSNTVAPVVVSSIVPIDAARGGLDTGPYIVPGEVPGSSASEPSGNFRFVCNYSHLSYDDPIVFPGQPGAAHLHMFFGNTGANADSTYESLLNSGGGSCQGGPLNRSSYWAPAVLNAAGDAIIPEYAVVYYKGTFGGASEIASIPEFPPGLRMIAGYDTADQSAPPHFDWTCEVGEISQQTVPDCADGELVGVRISFPQCWNGVDLDSPDHRSHMAYLTYSGGAPACPDGHPIHVPEYAIGIWFANDGNSQAWHLSSDVMPGMTHANGSTFHSDWIGAWDKSVQHTWLEECIHELRDCVAGQLGDGTDLSAVWPDHPYTGAKVIAPPPRP